MLCQIVNSLLLLPVSVARPLLSHLLDLLPPLDRLNRLLPAASPLEDQELQWPLHGELSTRGRKKNLSVPDPFSVSAEQHSCCDSRHFYIFKVQIINCAAPVLLVVPPCIFSN